MGGNSSSKRHLRPCTPQVSPSSEPEIRVEQQSAPVGAIPDTQSFRWEKGELIGRGAYGQVYKCRNLDTNESIVVKEVYISGGFNQIHRDVSSLKREILTLKTLHHPHIVRYLHTEVSPASDCIQIFLEYVPNGSLTELIQGKGKVGEDTARVYMQEIVEGLVYLHAQGVIHRDIKPDNILVDQHGHLKLTDFGAAKRLGREEHSMAAKSLIGSPYWMAPEVAKRIGHSFPSDIWSLGCVLIQLLSGKPPWSDTSQQAIVVLKLLSETQKLPSFPPAISLKCKSFLYRCLRLEPEKRATAEELRLHPFITGEELALEHAELLAAEDNDKEPEKPEIEEDSSLYDVVYDLAEIQETPVPKPVLQPITRVRSRQTLDKPSIEVMFERQERPVQPTRSTVRLLAREEEEPADYQPLNYNPDDVIAQTRYAQQLRWSEEAHHTDLIRERQRRQQAWERELRSTTYRPY